ncbi:MAG: GlsB/YeaQ/YmgE family stress response membrane protein [Abitibacteriaceae bacterium]|nr:GlsB/YeaQ/YmgE family stress response membrane protein [Abditibacteriaceae bacterium]MBV9863871.1 GlsB/YeaQ/YmgE family stress response membrane protein [Abditibacteriaceae bacterium]
MGLVDFLLLLVVAAIIGAIGEAIAGYSAGGCAMSAVIGFIGAMIGGWLEKSIPILPRNVIHVSGHSFPIVGSILGAALFVFILRLILGRRAVA